MPGTDYYQVLGVSADADPEALKRAFRLRARECHPDRNPSDTAAAERFNVIREAYATLSDPVRRMRYDSLLGADSLSATNTAMHEGQPDAGRNGSTARGDVRVTVSLDFEQAIRGGHAYVANGEGELIRVTVPRGCRDKTAVRVAGRGGHSQAQKPCDLYVTFRVRPHPHFRREGNHLHVIASISVMEAVLGTTRSIQNPYGTTIRISIPAGTQPGERLRLRGLGVQTARGTGDLFVEIDVRVPTELTDEQRQRLREAARHTGLL